MAQLVNKTDNDVVVPISDRDAMGPQASVPEGGVIRPVTAVKHSRNQRGMVTAE